MTKDYYAVLGIGRDATPGEIKTAYRRKAKEHHPDLNDGIGNTALFNAAHEAYQTLSDPEKRRRYDSGQLDSSSSQDSYVAEDSDSPVVRHRYTEALFAAAAKRELLIDFILSSLKPEFRNYTEKFESGGERHWGIPLPKNYSGMVDEMMIRSEMEFFIGSMGVITGRDNIRSAFYVAPPSTVPELERWEVRILDSVADFMSLFALIKNNISASVVKKSMWQPQSGDKVKATLPAQEIGLTPENVELLRRQAPKLPGRHYGFDVGRFVSSAIYALFAEHGIKIEKKDISAAYDQANNQITLEIPQTKHGELFQKISKRAVAAPRMA